MATNYTFPHIFYLFGTVLLLCHHHQDSGQNRHTNKQLLIFFVPVYTFAPIFKIPSVTSMDNIYSETFIALPLICVCCLCPLCTVHFLSITYSSHAAALYPPKVIKITSFPLTASFLLSFHLVSFFDL